MGDVVVVGGVAGTLFEGVGVRHCLERLDALMELDKLALHSLQVVCCSSDVAIAEECVGDWGGGEVVPDKRAGGEGAGMGVFFAKEPGEDVDQGVAGGLAEVMGVLEGGEDCGDGLGLGLYGERGDVLVIER